MGLSNSDLNTMECDIETRFQLTLEQMENFVQQVNETPSATGIRMVQFGPPRDSAGYYPISDLGVDFDLICAIVISVEI